MERGSESQDARSTRTPQHRSLPQNQDWESRKAARGPEELGDPEEKQQPRPTWQGTSCCHPTEDKTRGSQAPSRERGATSCPESAVIQSPPAP